MNRFAKRSRLGLIVTILFALIILPPALYGFGSKFRELVILVKGEEDGAFAITPVVNYLLISAGFFFLLCWAILHGMFRDVEKPKYSMLEREQELDQREATGISQLESERTELTWNLNTAPKPPNPNIKEREPQAPNLNTTNTSATTSPGSSM